MLSGKLTQVLEQFLAGQALSVLQQQQLADARANLWQVADPIADPEFASPLIEQRLQQFRSLHPALNAFCQTALGWPCPLGLLWDLWLPLAEQIVSWHRAEPNRTLILGVLGLQGTGKTTLTLILAEILRIWGLRVCSLSIDDFYKTYAERQQLQRADPRFCWRGPPGTHDVALGLSVLQALRAHQPVVVPRFDKSAQQGAGDRCPPNEVTAVSEVDLVLFEGWFMGLRPVNPVDFETAPPPIQTAADQEFAREINRRLADYLPLWAELDRLILIRPPDYRLSQQWRQQAEQQMRAQGKPGMTAPEVEAFVEYFWRALHPALFLPPLLTSGELDLVIQVNSERHPTAIYQPANCPDCDTKA